MGGGAKVSWKGGTVGGGARDSAPGELALLVVVALMRVVALKRVAAPFARGGFAGVGAAAGAAYLVGVGVG